MSTYITIYFTIGFIGFCVFQLCSRSKYQGGREYEAFKGLAWASLFAWPFVIAFGLVAGVLYAIVESLRFIDKIIDKVLRREV